jgi:hypothetical protein
MEIHFAWCRSNNCVFTVMVLAPSQDLLPHPEPGPPPHQPLSNRPAISEADKNRGNTGGKAEGLVSKVEFLYHNIIFCSLEVEQLNIL